MTCVTLRTTVWLLLLVISAGCSGESTSNYSKEATFNSKEQVVAGLVYGYTGKTLLTITPANATIRQFYISPGSGQYAITNYQALGLDENLFYASFEDGSRLYSVWSGLPTPAADVTVSFDQDGTVNPSNVSVSPDNFAARANINPITDLAYWYWLYDKKQSPYGYNYYLASVFLFFKGKYFLPEQNAVHDYPSAELLQMFNEIRIILSADATGFSLINNTTGNTICTATFAQFPICF